MIFQPLEQFELFIIHDLILLGFDFSITNYVISCGLILFTIWFFLVLPLKYSSIIPSNLDLLIEDLYVFIIQLFRQHTTNLTSLYYFPLIFSVFLFVFLSNFFGLFPFSFTPTSHIYTTFTLAFTLFFGIVILCFYNNKLNFLKFFVPSGVSNKPLLIFLVFIEIISYLIRPFSLAIRLFANMLAGHTLLYILGNFVYVLSRKYWVAIVYIPFFLVFLIVALEIFIAFIQSYVFVTLLVIYMNDIYNASH